MATPTATRPGRTIGVLAVLTALVFALIYVVAPDHIGKDKLSLATKYQPRLGLDLEGGTSVILTPRVAKGKTGSVTPDALNQAVAIIRNRVDSFGVAEAEVTTANKNIVISIPGKQDKNILATVQQTAELRFRQVLLSGAGGATVQPSPTASGTPSPSATSPSSPSPSASNQNGLVPRGLRRGARAASTTAPSPSPSPGAGSGAGSGPASGTAQITPALQAEFAALDCTDVAKVQAQLRKPGADDPKKPLVTCERDGSAKYILGPAEVEGTDVKTAGASLEQVGNQGATTGNWQVDLVFTGKGRTKFGKVTQRLVNETGDLNRFGIVLDGLVVSAPATNGAILNGEAQITGSFSQAEATDLANVLKYGALPLAFDPGDVQQVSATLGGDQLRAGLIAGGIGLLLVVLYSLLYYRGLGLVTIASLLVSAALTYGLVVLLGWQIGFRLSLAGVAGLIVAIGITADSFVVFFERLRDEVRDGKSLRVAVESGWARARRTILAADFVSFLAAVILYLLSTGSVRGFAFTLGLTTLLDIVVVFLFTKPLVSMLARTTFYGQGHRFSGLDPERLGSTRRSLLTPAPRRRTARETATSTAKEA